VTKILHRLDDIERAVSFRNNRQNPDTLTPPETVEETPQPLPAKDEEPVDTFGNNPVLYVYYPPDADGPRQQTLWKSIQHSFVYSVHQSAGLDFPFSTYFEAEMSESAFPFSLYQDPLLPLPNPHPEEVDR
jgi:hypothetical protein